MYRISDENTPKLKVRLLFACIFLRLPDIHTAWYFDLLSSLKFFTLKASTSNSSVRCCSVSFISFCRIFDQKLLFYSKEYFVLWSFSVIHEIPLHVSLFPFDASSFLFFLSWKIERKIEKKEKMKLRNKNCSIVTSFAYFGRLVERTERVTRRSRTK